MTVFSAKRVWISFFISSLLLAQSVWAGCEAYPQLLRDSSLNVLWRGKFSDGFGGWGPVTFQFGQQNTKFPADLDGRFPVLLRAIYPANSFDPGSAQKGLAPLGGLQFTNRFENIGVPSSDRFVLSFAVRFREGFNFMRGGKLPGFYGGTPRSGGVIPNGYDGFSTRIVWQTGGKGALYAYLPTSVTYGTVVGSGTWFFRGGRWMDISQAVKLNTPGISNGEIAVWIDGVLVHKECNLIFRNTDSLKIDGVFFSTFFGGNDPSWATPEDTYVDFADFRLSKLISGW